MSERAVRLATHVVMVGIVIGVIGTAGPTAGVAAALLYMAVGALDAVGDTEVRRDGS